MEKNDARLKYSQKSLTFVSAAACFIKDDELIRAQKNLNVDILLAFNRTTFEVSFYGLTNLGLDIIKEF